MSARVLNPVMLTEFYKISSPKMMKRNLPSNRKLNTIKKDLFGSPNPNETKRIFEDELEKHQDLACKKWGFDFRNGYPLGGNSQYIWERVSFNDFVPEMYTLSRAAHFRELPILETSSDEDILMDERAAKENELSISNFKCNLLSDGATTEEDEYDDDDDCDDVDDDHNGATIIIEVPIDSKNNNNRIMVAAATTACNSLRMKRRQPKITEFMKERRKRLAPTPKKMITPIKKMRMTSSSSSSKSLIKATSIAAGILNKRNKSPGKCNLFSSSSEGGGGGGGRF